MRAIGLAVQLAFCFIAACSFVTHAATLTLDIAAEPGSPSSAAAQLVFNGNSLTFQDAGDGFDFTVVNASDISLIGRKGNISGTFTIGAIGAGTPQTALVSGIGTLSIADGSSKLQADLDLNNVFSFGTSVGLNFNAQANLSNITYNGADASLLGMIGSSDGTLVLSAQFLPPRSLTQLTSGPAHRTFYTGQLNATVPEPSSYLALAVGLFATGAVIRIRIRN
jgi:hypothetical protein